MSLYYNPGKIDVEEAERGILATGGDNSSIERWLCAYCGILLERKSTSVLWLAT